MAVIYDKECYDELSAANASVQYHRRAMDAAAARRRLAIKTARRRGIGLKPISEVLGVTVTVTQELARRSKPDDDDWESRMPSRGEAGRGIRPTNPPRPQHLAAVEAQQLASA